MWGCMLYKDFQVESKYRPTLLSIFDDSSMKQLSSLSRLKRTSVSPFTFISGNRIIIDYFL